MTTTVKLLLLTCQCVLLALLFKFHCVFESAQARLVLHVTCISLSVFILVMLRLLKKLGQGFIFVSGCLFGAYALVGEPLLSTPALLLTVFAYVDKANDWTKGFLITASCLCLLIAAAELIVSTQVVDRVDSPDGRQSAVTLSYDAGATTSTSHSYFVRRPLIRGILSSQKWIADADEDAPPEAIRWIDDETVRIGDKQYFVGR